MIAGYYTHLFILGLHGAHLLYIVFVERGKLTPLVRNFLATSFFIILAVTPWV